MPKRQTQIYRSEFHTNKKCILDKLINLKNNIENVETLDNNNEKDISNRLETFEMQELFTESIDINNAILSIHAGAGGLDSSDWGEMLLRMYKYWSNKNGFKIKVTDLQHGEELGISSVSLRIVGLYAYGNMKSELGVHRLVRISPFDANKRRHTSFCAIDVIADLNETIKVEIKPEEIRIDTLRASGHGGQHLNKTESAIRITHIPTGIVVYSQNHRSQQRNKILAMQQLKSRIYEKYLNEKKSKKEKIYSEKSYISWGNQIRSYIFHPYKLVKDLRTGVETSDIQGVMNGNIDIFIKAWLRTINNKSI